MCYVFWMVNYIAIICNAQRVNHFFVTRPRFFNIHLQIFVRNVGVIRSCTLLYVTFTQYDGNSSILQTYKNRGKLRPTQLHQDYKSRSHATQSHATHVKNPALEDEAFPTKYPEN